MPRGDAILIRSHGGDIHATAVLWALGRLGVAARLWASSDFPGACGLSLRLGPGGVSEAKSRAGSAVETFADVRTVWNRRIGRALFASGLDPRDLPHARLESSHFLHGYLDRLCPSALWVNRPDIQRRDSDKAFQLANAAAVGMTVPPTLISNDPEEIRAFFEDRGGRVVHKSFGSRYWSKGDGRQAVGYTSCLRPEHLELDAPLAAAPAIYQAEIAKRDELRVTVMGATCFAAAIDSQADTEGRTDWRVAGGNVSFLPVEMPGYVRDLCLAYMRRVGMVFGCFDFVRTPDGEIVFLEVNQAGQFLWLEVLGQAFPMLAAFCAFLASADPEFRWDGEDHGIRFEDFEASDAFAAFTAAREDPKNLRHDRGMWDD